MQGRLEYKRYYANEAGYDANEPNEKVHYSYDTLGRKIDVNDANRVTVFGYDVEGNIREVNSPEGVIDYNYSPVTSRKSAVSTADTETQFGYDVMGRLKDANLVKRNGGSVSELTTYEYTAVGNRWKMHLPNGITTNYSYDNCNRLTSISHVDSSQQILGSYEYTLGDDGIRTDILEKQKHPGGTVQDYTIEYDYDNLNRLINESAVEPNAGGGYEITYKYDVVGNRTYRQVIAGGQTVTTTYTYDSNTDQLVSEVHDGPEWAMLLNDKPVYAYAGNGGIIYKGAEGKIGKFKAFVLGLPTEWAQYALAVMLLLLPVTFIAPMAIKALWRLSGRSPPSHLAGLQQCIAAMLAYMMLISPTCLQAVAEGAILYSQLDARHWTEGNRTIEYGYDSNGSLTSKVTKVTSPEEVIETVTYDYNLQNRLARVTTSYTQGSDDINDVTEYTYNDGGIRVRSYHYQTVNGGNPQDEETKTFLIDAHNHTGYAQVLEEYDGTNRTTYTIGDDVITQQTSGSNPQHLLYDGHGSTRQLADSAGGIVEAFSYDGYGVLLGGNPTRSSPSATSLLYTGEYFDNDAQQYYLRARWYDSLNGRFNQLDPYAGNNYDPQSLHKYLYCHANPVNAIDPSGKGAWSIGIVLVAITITILSLARLYDVYGPKRSAATNHYQNAILKVPVRTVIVKGSTEVPLFKAAKEFFDEEASKASQFWRNMAGIELQWNTEEKTNDSMLNISDSWVTQYVNDLYNGHPVLILVNTFDETKFGVLGRTAENQKGCAVKRFSYAATIAHEFGHIFITKAHSFWSPNNLMSRSDSRNENLSQLSLTQDQVDKARRTVYARKWGI